MATLFCNLLATGANDGSSWDDAAAMKPILAYCLLFLPTVAQPPIQDYTTTAGLHDLGGVQRGKVVYHLSANEYGVEKFREQIQDLPPGTHVMFDWEPWIKNKNEFPWYGDGTDKENLEHFERYAWFVREVTPDLIEKQLTLSLYSTPVLMQRNWVRVWRGEDGPNSQLFLRWKGEQIKVIQQAEQAGLLPALRACGGHVSVVAYLPPNKWDDKKWANLLQLTINNMDAVLDDHNVPHRWLARPSQNGKPIAPAMREVFLERGVDWWEYENTAGINALREALK